MAKNNSKTKAFSTDTKKSKKSVKNKKRLRRKVVVSIFAIIALILVVFATLIIAKIVEKASNPNPTPTPPSNENIRYIPRDAGNVKMGNLLLINDFYTYSLPSELNDMINIIYDYRKNDANKDIIKIGDTYTYALSYDRICLTKETLDAFSKMVFDYCNSVEGLETNKNSFSNLEIAWGGYSEATREEYEADISQNKDFYDHALGTTITLKTNSPSDRITESELKTNFEWIYNNSHKYGFIIRYSNEHKDHTGFDSTIRVHLRYIGVEHATYIFNNNICFEEYLELIRTKHGYNNPLVINSANGKTYNVYYVAYSGNPTSVPVPKDSNYVISGDNMNGFIVTVEK